MTDSEKPKLESTPEQIALLRTILYIGAFAFMTLGLICYAYPSQTAEFLFGTSEDQSYSYILGTALLFVGITDLIIVKTVFKKSDRK